MVFQESLGFDGSSPARGPLIVSVRRVLLVYHDDRPLRAVWVMTSGR